MKVTVVGIGYVGLSNPILLSQMHKVIAYDVDTNRVEKLNNNHQLWMPVKKGVTNSVRWYLEQYEA